MLMGTHTILTPFTPSPGTLFLRRILPLILLAGFPMSPTYADLIINEIDIDQLGADRNEFVEILNTGPNTVNFATFPHTLVFFNGDDDAIPFIDGSYRIVSLTGTLAPDEFLLIADPGVSNADIIIPGGDTNLIQNGPDAIALYADPASVWSGQQSPTTQNLVDAIAYVTDDTSDNVLETSLNLKESHNEWDGIGSVGAVFSIARGDGGGPFQTGSTPTPGAPNDSLPPVFAIPNVTLLLSDPPDPVTVTLTGDGGAGTLSFRLMTLPLAGTLFDGNNTITPATPLPHTVTSTLSYLPESAYTGLDSFTFVTVDALDRVSEPATHELAVQTGGIVISEVMHSPGRFDTPQDQRIFEYIEIFNLSANPIVLTRLDSNPNTIIDTTSNLFTNGQPAIIPPNTMRIIAPGGLTPEADRQFACEWGLDESDIIRIHHESYETMFPGTRVLLFGIDDVLLDAVNFFPGDFWPQSFAASQSVKEAFLDIFGVQMDAAGNYTIVLWPYSGPGNALGVRTSYSGIGVGSPGFIPADVNENFTPLPECLPPPLGACCLTNGLCAALSEPNCADRDGIYSGDHVLCSTITPCPQPPTAACCMANGGCTVTDAISCVSLDGTYGGDDLPCLNIKCPTSFTLIINEIDYNQPGTDTSEYIELFGTPDLSIIGTRILFYNGDTGTLYRTITLNGSLPADGIYVVGSLNVPNLDQLEFTTEGIQNGPDGLALLSAENVLLDAIAYGQTFIAFDGPVAGAILEDIRVADDAPSDANASAEVALQRIPNGTGEWRATSDLGAGPDGTPGALNAIPLPQPHGACCLPDASCIDAIPQSACLNAGGVYREDASLCNDSCPTLIGACCIPNGLCQHLTDATCTTLSGTFHGPETTCDTAPICPTPTITACCLAGGNCIDEDAYDCDTLGGQPIGDPSSCANLNPGDCSDEEIPRTINEIYRNDPGTDNEEFIEISGTGGTSLTGIAILEIEGDVSLTGQTGRIDRVWSLDGFTIPGDGLFLLANTDVPNADFILGSINTLENGTATYLLIENFDAIKFPPGTDIDSDDNGQPDLNITLGNILDAIAFADDGIDEPQPDLVYFDAAILGPSGTQSPAGLARRIDGLDSDSPADFCQLALSPEDDLAQPTPGQSNLCTSCTLPGDATGDQAVDLLDFAAFQRCFTENPPKIFPPQCNCLDFNADEHITLSDFDTLNQLIDP